MQAVEERADGPAVFDDRNEQVADGLAARAEERGEDAHRDAEERDRDRDEEQHHCAGAEGEDVQASVPGAA